MSDRIIQQRWLIRELKREKKRRLRREELARQVVICSSCGGQGHRDARSWSCPNNSHFGQLTRRQREAQEQRERRVGGRRLRERVRNPNARQCRLCINDNCLPHSNRGSSRCHAHIPNSEEIMQNLLGPDPQRRVRKCTLSHALKAPGLNRQRRVRRKRAVIREINRVVDWVNQVAIKTQAFLSFYVLHTISNQVRNPDNPDNIELVPSVFHQNGVYGFIQLVVGRPITNNGLQMPANRVAVFDHYKSLFEDPSSCSVQNIRSYSGCLSNLAKTMATSNLNSIVETFEGRALKYLAFRMRQELPYEDWPSVTVMNDICSHMYSRLAQAEAHALPENLPDVIQAAVDRILANDGLLGPAPIKHDTLKAGVEIYASHLWRFLDEMETSQLQPEEEKVVDKCDMRWLKSTLSDHPDFRRLLRRKRQCVLKSVLNIINSDTPEFTIRLNIAPRLIRDLTDIINNARGRLERSKIYLQGNSILHARDCFQSTTTSAALCTKLFSLLPGSHFTKKFVTFTPGCWRRVFAVAGAPLVYDGQGEGHVQMVRNLDTFTQSLNFKKVRLANSEDNLQHYDLNHPPTGVRYVFDNVVRTDGYTIEFVFGVKEPEALPDLCMKDLAYEDMEDYHMYPIDPGHKHLVTSFDENGRQVRFSNNEWYSKAGFMKRRRMQQDKKQESGITDIESQLPSRKTADPENFAECCGILFDNLPRLCSFYGSDFAEDRFLNYMGGQKMSNEVVNLFVTGGNKYSHRTKEDVKLPLLLLGSKGTTSVRGKKRSMASKAIRALKRAENEGLLLVCEVNEDYTSKVCCSCHRQSNVCKEVIDRFSGREVSLWSVLECQNCHHIWNRDKNACTNIAYLARLERELQERPAVFSRRIPFVPPSTTSSSSEATDEGGPENDPPNAALDVTPSQQLDEDIAHLNI